MTRRASLPLVLSCEHASRAIPRALEEVFRGVEQILDSHRGWDPDALDVARRLAKAFGAPLIAGRYSRLVVDLNRSPHHPRVLSEWTRQLELDRRRALLALHTAHWQAVEATLTHVLREHRQVFHVAVHSFTPVLDGEVRNADVGLLYDPGRPTERDFALRLREALVAGGVRVRRNYPYRGVADGLPTALRRRLGRSYVGLELELNQAFVAAQGPLAVGRKLETALLGALGRDVTAG